jgi:hypothetical protein
MTGKVFSIKNDAIKECHVLRHSTSVDLFDILLNLVKDKPLGFDETTLPDKTWMQKIIYALNPSHSIFKETAEGLFLREIPESKFFNIIRRNNFLALYIFLCYD